MAAIVLSTCVLAGSMTAAGQTNTNTNTGTLPLVQAYQADSFVDSIGVVTHLSYTNTPYYTAWPQIYDALQNLGVRHIRDGYYNWDTNSPFILEHQQLAQAGIDTDYVVPVNTATTAADIEQFSGAVRDMGSLEAPNECDLAGSCGSTIAASMTNMLGSLPTLDVAGQALGMPVLGPSLTQSASYGSVGNIASAMQYNNLHVYFGGRNPGSTGWGAPDPQGNFYGSFAYWLDQANQDAPNVPVVVTESGYLSFQGQSVPYTVPENVEGSYIPRTLLLAYKDGIKRTYIYELLDEVSSPGYGIMRSDLTPKPAYTAVQGLIANLWDKGPSFTPGKLAYAVEGGDSTLQQLLFQKRDGSFWLVLWLEQSSFDTVTYTPTPVTPQSVTLTVGSSYVIPNIGTFDDTGNLEWTSTNPAGSVVPLTVSDHVTIVKILPQG